MPAFGTSIAGIGRAAGFLIVAGMIVAATIHMRGRIAGLSSPEPNAAKQDDPLSAELNRCQRIGMAAATDTACESAWAENRRRFFTYGTPPASVATPAATPERK
jgi:conjugative transfer region protein TrbK